MKRNCRCKDRGFGIERDAESFAPGYRSPFAGVASDANQLLEYRRLMNHAQIVVGYLDRLPFCLGARIVLNGNQFPGPSLAVPMLTLVSKDNVPDRMRGTIRARWKARPLKNIAVRKIA